MVCHRPRGMKKRGRYIAHDVVVVSGREEDGAGHDVKDPSRKEESNEVETRHWLLSVTDQLIVGCERVAII